MLSVTMAALNAAQKEMNVTSNNLANASTVGFKRSYANFGDVFGMSIVKDVQWTGSGWQLTCEPVNPYLANSGGMAVTDSSGSLFEWMSGMSTTSTWTYTTTTFGISDYIYIQCLSQKSQTPVNFV